jgi:predicted nucleotidyltransferase component of viral defense system
MDRGELKLTYEEKSHSKVMRAITQSFSDTPLVLKGGTALLFGYGLDRFSEDLDFDSSKKISLESRIQRCLPHGVEIKAFGIVKNTDTMTCYRLAYVDGSVESKLKIEVSYRSPVMPSEVSLIDGMRILSVSRLLDHKIAAAHDGEKPRTKIRDLYDLDFIVTKYPENISAEQLHRLKKFSMSPDVLMTTYRDAYQFESLV